MITFPNAKINIGLQIVRRRADGYHDLLTVFHPLGWTDALEITPAPGRGKGDHRLYTSGRPVACEPADNLVMKAVREIDAYAGLPCAVDIYLRKVILDGAGLGGGSSDASATIRLLNDMFALGMPDGEMALIAGRLGADCPYFIYGSTMMAEGTGDVFTSMRADREFADDCRIVAVKPPVYVSTADAFRGATPRGEADYEAVEAIASLPPEQWAEAGVVNDFEPQVFAAHPGLAAVKSDLYSLGAAYASLSGSGSALYGIFRRNSLCEEELQRWSTEKELELFIS